MSEIMVRPLFLMFFVKNGFSCCNRLIITWELLVVGLEHWAQEGRRRKNSPGWQVERHSVSGAHGVPESLTCGIPALPACSRGARRGLQPRLTWGLLLVGAEPDLGIPAWAFQLVLFCSQGARGEGNPLGTGHGAGGGGDHCFS